MHTTLDYVFARCEKLDLADLVYFIESYLLETLTVLILRMFSFNFEIFYDYYDVSIFSCGFNLSD
jgi:hypothetical protein